MTPACRSGCNAAGAIDMPVESLLRHAWRGETTDQATAASTGATLLRMADGGWRVARVARIARGA